MINKLSLFAFLLGFFGVAMAAFENNFIEEAPPAPELKEKSLKEMAALAAKKVIQEKILHTDSPPPPRKIKTVFGFEIERLPLKPYQMIYTALGVLAMGLGTFAWTQRAHVRLSGGAVALGIMAVAWQWVLVAIAIAVIVLILSQFNA